MRRSSLLLVFTALLAFFPGCAAPRMVQAPTGSFTVKDYLKTAYDTLLAAETDTEGHRIRAQLETRAALAAIEDPSPGRRVPFDGPPTLAVALELLERSQLEATQNVLAQTHATRAAAELRQALGLR